MRNIVIETEKRLCSVEGRTGYFLAWEHYSDIIPPSLLQGGHSGGVFSRLYGIIEFDTGIERVDPIDVKFCDQTHAELCSLVEFQKEQEIKKTLEKINNVKIES